jgi:hypothetical protein
MLEQDFSSYFTSFTPPLYDTLTATRFGLLSEQPAYGSLSSSPLPVEKGRSSLFFTLP